MSTSGKLLIASFVVLAAGLFALLKLTDTDEAKAGRPAALAESAKASDEPAAAGTAQVAAGSAAPAPTTPAGAAPSRPTISLPAMAGLGSGSDDLPRRPDGVLIGVVDRSTLNKAVIGTDAQLNDCIAKHGGKDIDGTLVTTFVVARVKDPSGVFKVAVESTGYEEEGSTIADPKLIECLHTSATAMQFPPSTSPVAVWAKRKLTIAHGDLAQNWVFQHGYIK